MTLVIGYGNPMRSDDNLGVYVAELLEKDQMPDVEIKTCHQLTPELIEDMIRFDRIFLIDAAAQEEEFRIESIEKRNVKTLASSHHVDPYVLFHLLGSLYRKKPPIFVCTIAGDNFNFGSELSPSALEKANRFLPLLKQHIREAIYA
jgi:hydrogenase maturation protease